MSYKKYLRKAIELCGDNLPKKHGCWYRVHVYGSHYLVLDTWNGYIYHYPDGATPSSTDNMYRCVYVFHDSKGGVNNYERVPDNMLKFWYGHIGNKTI